MGNVYSGVVINCNPELHALSILTIVIRNDGLWTLYIVDLRFGQYGVLACIVSVICKLLKILKQYFSEITAPFEVSSSLY